MAELNGTGGLEERVLLLERHTEDIQLAHRRLLDLANANARRLQALEQYTQLVPRHEHQQPHPSGLRSIPPTVAKHRGTAAWLAASVLALVLQYLAAMRPFDQPQWQQPPPTESFAP